MNRSTKHDWVSRWLVVIPGIALAALGGCKKGCGNKRSAANPWARALPTSTAAYGLPQQADAIVTVNRQQLLLAGKPLLKLKDGRLPGTLLRDGVDGLYVPTLASALGPLAKKRPDGTPSHGRLAIHCQPAVPFRTLRAVLYTAMRAGFSRPWLVAESAGRRVGLPLELPSVSGDQGHGLRPSPTRTPALAIGLDGKGLHVSRWGRSDCPAGPAATATSCASLGTGLNKTSLSKLGAHLRSRYLATAQRPGGRRPPSNAIMVWAGLDVTVGGFVRLLDAAREAPGAAGTCKLTPHSQSHHWKRTSPLVDPAGKSIQGCLYHQTVLVWSKPGHRKK